MSAPIHRWVADPPGGDVEGSLARLASAPDVVRIAVMPDVHLAHDVCIGTVVATSTRIYPAAIGGDVGCGVATLRCGGSASALDRPGVADAILSALPVAAPIHRHRRASPLPPELAGPPDAIRRRDAEVQFGTLGRGNHFLELQADEEDRLWILVHTGSRSVGPAIQRRANPSGGLASIDADSAIGRGYLDDLAWAVRYAQLSRQAILAATARVLHDVLGGAPEPDTYVECAHNAVVRHRGCWVHRKGAIPAEDGVLGVIPGSMGSATHHVVGRGCPDALWSASHGAGRCMSRTRARQAISAADLSRQISGIHSRSRRVEEAPGAYKDIGAVMRAQRDLVRILGTLHPRLNHRA